MNNRTFRRWPFLGLVLGLMIVLLSQPAEAFWKKKKNDDDKQPVRGANLNLYPEMDFYRGTLHQGTWGDWELDSRPLRFLPEARVSTLDHCGGVSQLRDGNACLVQGYIQEGELVVYHVTLFDLDKTLQENRFIRRRVEGLPTKMDPGEPQ